LNSALNIGRSALLSYQGALQTVGNNISSAGSPDYTRLTPQLDPVQGMLLGRDLQPGAGVALTDIRRMIDEALEGRVRLATGSQQEAGIRQSALAQVESFFDDLSGAGLGARLTEFWTLFDELQNTPEDPALRDLVISGGTLLADSMRTLRGELVRLGEDLDTQIGHVVARADEIAREIAELNSEITTAEAGRRAQATALRDQRDALLRELSELLDVTVREQPDGSLNIYIGGETLVQANTSRGLIAVTETDGEFMRTSARFADTNQQVQVRGGQLAGLIAVRDQDAYGRIAALDDLAAAVIADINRVHADGQGLAGFRSVVGANDLFATNLPLNSPAAGLPFSPQSGGFYVTVLDDATQTPVGYRIAVDLDGGGAADTTLDSLVTSFNSQVTGVVASVTSDRRLAFTANPGYSFVFGYDGQAARSDTSGVLAALGVNTFFSGTNASNIDVNDVVRNDPNLIAAASVFLSGDGANASRMAALSEVASQQLGGVSLNDFYHSISNSAAVSAAGANANLEAAGSVLSALRAQKESVSGVNLDEEAISLLKYERSFQGAARFVTVVDELLGELVTLIR
jgi:flagellar hook-associated protein 1 FlgK